MTIHELGGGGRFFEKLGGGVMKIRGQDGDGHDFGQLIAKVQAHRGRQAIEEAQDQTHS